MTRPSKTGERNLGLFPPPGPAGPQRRRLGRNRGAGVQDRRAPDRGSILPEQGSSHGTLRLSELEKAIPGVSRKMLVQQLRELEREGVASRTVYPQVPPKVEYGLTEWGKAMCPVLDALLEWAAQRPKTAANGPFNS